MGPETVVQIACRGSVVCSALTPILQEQCLLATVAFSAGVHGSVTYDRHLWAQARPSGILQLTQPHLGFSGQCTFLCHLAAPALGSDTEPRGHCYSNWPLFQSGEFPGRNSKELCVHHMRVKGILGNLNFRVSFTWLNSVTAGDVAVPVVGEKGRLRSDFYKVFGM